MLAAERTSVTNGRRLRMFRMSIATRLVGYLLLAGIVPLFLLGYSSFEISRGIVIDLKNGPKPWRLTPSGTQAR